HTILPSHVTLAKRPPWFLSALLIVSAFCATSSAQQSEPQAASADEVRQLRELVLQLQKSMAEMQSELQHVRSEGPVSKNSPASTATSDFVESSSSAQAGNAETQAPAQAVTQNKQKAEPFAFADWTWLNGNPRTKEPAFDSKFFT